MVCSETYTLGQVGWLHNVKKVSLDCETMVFLKKVLVKYQYSRTEHWEISWNILTLVKKKKKVVKSSLERTGVTRDRISLQQQKW